MSHLDTTQRLFYQEAGLDPRRLETLLDRALATADDGELFLEYRQSEGLVLDDGRIKTASFNTSQGFGLRAVSGEAAGYAHASELSEAAIERAVAAVGAVTAGHSGVVGEAPLGTNSRLYADANPIEAIGFAEKVKLLTEIDAFARAKDPRVRQVTASLFGEWQAVEILRAGGERRADVRPLIRLNVQVVVGDGDRQESGGYGTGGRIALPLLFDPAHWQHSGGRGAAPGPGQPRGRPGAGRRDAGAARARLARHPAARGGGPRPGGRLQPQGHLGLLRAPRPARRLRGRHRGRRRHARRPPRQPDHRRRGHPHQPHHADRGRHPDRLHAGPAERAPDGHAADRQRPPPVLCPHPHAAHDQHHHAGRPGGPAGDPALGEEGALRRLLRRRPGRHHLGQVRLLRAPRPTASRTARSAAR